MDKFMLTIEMGNDAMQRAEDVSDALQRLASYLDHEGPEVMKMDGAIFDANGNTVGRWEVS